MAGRVLITGGAGFIGSHVAEAYLEAGWEVVIVDNLSSGNVGNVPDGARFVEADIRSAEAQDLIAGGKFDVLNHHAAQIDVRVSVEEPALDADINVRGLVNMLAGARAGNVRRVIFASSGGVVYGNPDATPTPETAPKRPVSPYGVSKLAGEHYLHALGSLYGFERVALRYSNIFGPRQDPRSEAGVISIFISRLLAGEPLIVFGDGHQTRDYVFVKDVARANLLASTATLGPPDGIDASAFNIGTSIERSVLDLTEVVGRPVGMVPDVEFAPARAGELLRSALDATKAKAQLGWSPAARFEDGIADLIHWFREEAP